MSDVYEQIPSNPFHGTPLETYRAGFCGCFGTHDDCPTWARRVAEYDRERLRDQVGRATFSVESVFPSRLVGTGAGKKSLNHLHVMRYIPQAYSGSQSYGNCRAWSAKFASQTVLGMEIDSGELHRYDFRHGTALVYGSRQSSSQGMSMSRGCEVMSQIGQSEQKDYGFVDLSTQKKDEDYGNSWGRGGPPKQLIEAVAGDTVERAYWIESPTEELIKDLLYNQAAIDTGSTVTGRGPGNPLVGLESIGGHAQCCTGYDDTDECRARLKLKDSESVIFMQQSWGDWIEINNWPDDLWGTRPEGCWPITMENFLRLVRGWNDSWCIVGINGFTGRKLPDWGSHLYL